MNVTQHLKDRHVNLDLHRFLVDEEEKVACVLMYNLSDQIVGYQQYRPLADKTKKNSPRDGRYYTYKREGTVVVFGVESLHLTPHLVFLTEGVFDAARLISRGFSALAVLTNNPTPDLQNWLTTLNRKVVAVCDNDKAGLALAKFGHEAVFLTTKDVGDSTEEELDELLRKYHGTRN
jgi:hypothetical protein